MVELPFAFEVIEMVEDFLKGKPGGRIQGQRSLCSLLNVALKFHNSAIQLPIQIETWIPQQKKNGDPMTEIRLWMSELV